MDESKCVEYFDACRRGENPFVETVLEQGICRQAKPGSEPLSSDCNHISQRVIKAGRLFGEFDIPEKGFNGAVYNTFADHFQFSDM